MCFALKLTRITKEYETVFSTVRKYAEIMFSGFLYSRVLIKKLKQLLI
jgi:hypothetical protein